MEEADALASRAAILSRRLLAIGTTQSLRAAYSARYHVSLVLTTAPLSRADEMRTLEEWVDRELGGLGAALEPHSLGGQVKFTVPLTADPAALPGEEGHHAGDGGIVVGTVAGGGGIGAVIKKIEASKKELGVAYYAIGSATLEHVFMSVVKENHVLEEDEKVGGRWWRWQS
jgi:ATP-binding cassette, subfamily A (ABC1), member 3